MPPFDPLETATYGKKQVGAGFPRSAGNRHKDQQAPARIVRHGYINAKPIKLWNLAMVCMATYTVSICIMENDIPLTIPLIEHQIASWENANPPEIAADFAPNAVFISPGGRWIGPEAIRAAAEGFFSTVSEVRVEVRRIIQCGDRGVIEWLWSERRKSTGLYHIAEDAVVFVLEDGKIVYWREYFDPGQMDAGVDSAYP